MSRSNPENRDRERDGCYLPGPVEAGRGQDQAPPFFVSAWNPKKQRRQTILTIEECRQRHAKPDIVVRIVRVVRVVPVAIGTAHVPWIVVERAATNHAAANELTLFRTRVLRLETWDRPAVGYPAYSAKPLKRFKKSAQFLINTAINRGVNETYLISCSRFNGFPEQNR